MRHPNPWRLGDEYTWPQIWLTVRHLEDEMKDTKSRQRKADAKAKAKARSASSRSGSKGVQRVESDFMSWAMRTSPEVKAEFG